LVGDLTLHGVTRPTEWDVTAEQTGDHVTGIARTTVKITDFGMERPRTAVVLSVEDEMQLEINFAASSSA
jgi:polyisoprenoid-binding protein YceI